MPLTARLFTLALALGVSSWGASVYSTNFDSMTPGSIAGQEGWNSSINSSIDQSIKALGGGDNVFQMSDAFGSLSFADYPYGPAITSSGESDPNNLFQMSLSFETATAVPQPGLLIGVSPYQDQAGSANRQGSFFIGEFGGDGLVVAWQDWENNGTCGSSCFVNHILATNVTLGISHTLSLSLDFVPGADNDVATVSFDGGAPGTFGDYEGYYAAVPGIPSPDVNSVLFKTFSSNTSTTPGQGLYFDALSYSSSSTPEPATFVLFGLGMCGLGLIRRRR